LKPYPGYLFDLDGTLIDTAPDLNAALNFALREHNFKTVDESLTRHWIGHGGKVMVEQALDLQALDFQEHRADNSDSVLDAFLAYYEDHVAVLSQPYPAVLDALASLTARGARMAVVTNKMTTFSVAIMDALNMAQYFDCIVGGDTATSPKPAADPALHACAKLGIAPADALFVGDSETDVLCARAAGCPVVCVRDGYNHGVAAEKLGADAIIESFSDLV
jgi:phosphoglycolate phosphatase